MHALRQAAGYWLAVLVAGTLVLLAMLPPFVGADAREVLMHAFSSVCHQMPDRTFDIGGIPFALCHRCTGIAIGLLLAALAAPWLRSAANEISRRAPLALGLAVLPMAVDWSGDVVGLWVNTPGTRVATGLVFGVVVGLLLARAFRQLATGAKPPAPAMNTSS